MHSIQTDLLLEDTLGSGQTFAFVPHEEGYVGVVQGRALYVCKRGDALMLDCPQEDIAAWHTYFDLERDYAALLSPFEHDPLLGACLQSYQGLRVLRQPVWETICAFILSANNHQRRIASLYLGIAQAGGEPVEIRGKTLYTFPSPGQLCAMGEECLRKLGTGYRAPYLVETARMIRDGFSLTLDSLSYEEALKHLMRLPGVGEKVADCVLLFSSSHGQAFPVDVWIDKVMRGRYGLTGSRSSIKRAAMALFGPDAGRIQQILFHAARTGTLPLFAENEPS